MLNKRFRWTIGLCVSLCFLAIFPLGATAETYLNSIVSDGREREFMLVLPEGAKPGRPLPVIVALHGGLMTGRSMRRVFGLEGIEERGRFAVVYPNGIGRRWNDGRFSNDEPDDVRFLSKLAEHLVRERIADPRRLYLLGVSNGGMMAFRMACEAPGVFAAYSATIASMPVNVAESCPPGKGAPMLIINSTGDPIVPWEGGEVGGWVKRGEVLSTPATVEFWRRRNGCKGQAESKPLPDKDKSDGSTVFAQQYADCRSEAPVVLLEVEGGGHLPPGANIGDRPILQSILGGPANQDISAADISWKFFKRFPL
jgi:polyhydroxybutyrate depolymerase